MWRNGLSRADVEHGEFFDLLRMVQREAVGDAGAAVMADQMKFLVAQRLHQLDLVQRQGALGIVTVIGQAGGLGRIAIAAQVCRYHGVMSSQARRDPVPDAVRLRITVQQQHGGTAAAAYEVDAGAAHCDLPVFESRKKRVHARNSFPCSASVPDRPGILPMISSCRGSARGSSVAYSSRVGTSS